MTTTNRQDVTLELNGHIFTEYELGGDILSISSPNPATSRINGTGNSVSIGKRNDAGVKELVVRAFLHGADDIFLNNALNSNFSTVLNGSIVESYEKDGAVFQDTYILENGSITSQPTKGYSVTDGNAVMEYTIEFRNSVRIL